MNGRIEYDPIDDGKKQRRIASVPFQEQIYDYVLNAAMLPDECKKIWNAFPSKEARCDEKIIDAINNCKEVFIVDNFDKIISHPDHYCEGRKYEPKDVIYDWGLDFNLGSAVKYLSRAGRKENNSKEQDLKKAIQYIQFELEADRKREKK